MIVTKIKSALARRASKSKARLLQGFFKTGPGEYGAGDIFIGVTVPNIREVAAVFQDQIGFSDISQLIRSKIHEERLLSLIMLTHRFARLDAAGRRKIFQFYLRSSRYINNWDLVDLSAPRIVGAYLWDGPRDVLYELARSRCLWERRIAMVATAYFISKNDLSDTLKIARILLNDKHDLIQKASGWMLREAGKRDEKVLTGFLDRYAGVMPRTMLRYSIERLPKSKKQFYMRRGRRLSAR